MPATFVPRLTDSGVNGGSWWYTSTNPFYAAGYGMPNCTCYAYGRYAEARNAWASLPTWDAKDWYDDATGFQRGAVPGLGAVMCWGTTGSGPGHVAIVEQIAANGDVTISESHYTSSLPYWDLQTLTAASGYSHPYLDSTYYIQGFIYNDWGPGSGGQPIIASWQTKTTGGYARNSAEALQNALCTYRKLSALGWSLNAVCGVLGNMEIESGYNPWRWESDAVPNYPSTPSYGYGLAQFTPSSKYISDSHAQGYSGYGPNWADHAGKQNDGDAQLEFIHNYADYYPTSTYPLTFEEYKISTYNAGLMALAWLYNYERPGDPGATEQDRIDAANYWFAVLGQYGPGGWRPWKFLAQKRGAKVGYIRRKRLFRY